MSQIVNPDALAELFGTTFSLDSPIGPSSSTTKQSSTSVLLSHDPLVGVDDMGSGGGDSGFSNISSEATSVSKEGERQTMTTNGSVPSTPPPFPSPELSFSPSSLASTSSAGPFTPPAHAGHLSDAPFSPSSQEPFASWQHRQQGKQKAGDSTLGDQGEDTEWGERTLLLQRPDVTGTEKGHDADTALLSVASTQHGFDTAAGMPSSRIIAEQRQRTPVTSASALSQLLKEGPIETSHLHMEARGERTLLPRKYLDDLLAGIEEEKRKMDERLGISRSADGSTPGATGSSKKDGSSRGSEGDASTSSNWSSASSAARERETFSAFGNESFCPPTFAPFPADPYNERGHTLDLLPRRAPAFLSGFANGKVEADGMVPGEATYICATCGTQLALQDELISKSFSGREGKAFLFHTALNTAQGKQEERQLLTGLHVVADLRCRMCHRSVGWTYVKAFEASQKYKEGKFILEKCALRKENGWM